MTVPSAAAQRPEPPVAPSAVPPAPQVEPIPQPAELGEQRRRLRDDPRIPATLVSTIVHTLLLLILALFTYREGSSNQKSLTARQGEPSSVVALEALQPLEEPALAGSVSEQSVAVKIDVVSEAVIDPIGPTSKSSPQQMPSMQTEVLGSASTVSLPGQGGLERRDPESRLEYGRPFGATRESEQAVEDALAYLAAHQRDNGSWSFNLELDPCRGRCRHSKKAGEESPTPATGATGLALLAFLGAGHTHHREGPYQETVRRGIYYLRSVAAEAQAGYDWQQGSMYGHGIALMALAEALTMSTEGDQYESDLKSLVELGSNFTSVAQHRSGSWGYVPGSPGDMTVTGWQVLSLIAARKGGITLRTNSLPDAKDFVLSTCTNRDYWFGYKGPPGEPTTTAIGCTLMLYLGESPYFTPFQDALTKMAERGPTRTNIYHDYYATLALHHSQHRLWDKWNEELREHLIASQVKTGHEKGSWHFADRWGDVGGRLYTTAMCAMTLEIYYRYMPLYEEPEDFPL